MKNLLIYLLLINIYGVMAQTPQTDLHWTLNSTFSDEFNGVRKNIWQDMSGPSIWGSETFLPQNIQYGIEGNRSFLRLVAEIINGVPFTGGIGTGYSNGYLGLGYGYYEIEARVLETPDIVSGIWPAFWTIHASKNPPPYWYEEIDIFEPANCSVRNNEHRVKYHHPIDENYPIDYNFPDNWKKELGVINNVDMSLWHKYAVEWLPERLTFYLDDEAFFELNQKKGENTPSHENTNVKIDLQTDRFETGWCPPSISNGILGYYDINYFRYYQLRCGNEIITESQGNGYDFNNFIFNVKKSCIFKNTSIPVGTNISIRATDFIELKENFEVPLGAELFLDVNPCGGITLASQEVSD